jgi:hypothetical protein
MAELIYKLIFCHLIGDYVLQIDYIAKTKGENMYHLLVHCFLYAVPFYITFGYDVRIPIIITTHIVSDMLKARYKAINYVTDQVLHYLVMLIYLI